MMERRVYSLKFEEFECNSKDLRYPLRNFLISRGVAAYRCLRHHLSVSFLRTGFHKMNAESLRSDRNVGSNTMLVCPGFLDPGFLWKPQVLCVHLPYAYLIYIFITYIHIHSYTNILYSYQFFLFHLPPCPPKKTKKTSRAGAP